MHTYVKSGLISLMLLTFILVLASTVWSQSDSEPQNQAIPRLKDDMRMPWVGEGVSYILDWLVCGVFPSLARPADQPSDRSPSGQGFDIDYLKDTGSEASIKPIAGDTAKRPDGSTATWTRYTSDGDIINFARIFSGQQITNSVAYAFTTIQRDEAGKMVLAIGSDDSVKVYLNGKIVHENCVGRAVQKDQDIVPVTMEKGDNHVLIKVDNGAGDWGFSLRLLNETQALAIEAGEIQPRIELSPKDNPDLLIINTDVGFGSRNLENIQVDIVFAGGKLPTQTKVTGVEAKRGQKVEFDTKDWQDGPYEIRVSRVASDGKRVFRYLPWYKGDWVNQVKELLDQRDSLPANLDEATAGHYRLLGDLVLDSLGGDPRSDNRIQMITDGWKKIHSPLMEHYELRFDNAIRPNGFVRLAWKDEVDDSAQYARAYLPPDYDSKKKYPMVVGLHGYNSANPEYINWWGVTERHNGIADRNSVIVIEPHGRGNTGYEGIGEMDVLTAIRIAKKTFSVDDDRVYLMGYSMGGGGTWFLGTRHPELFAAIGPFYGGWDYHIYLKEEELAKLTPYQRFGSESESSFAQAEALLTTPVFVNHGDSDELVTPDYSRYVVKMLQRWGYNIRYWEHPGGGHGGFEAEKELLRWFLSHTLERNPMEVRIRSASLKSASAHWVKIQQNENPLSFIFANARIMDKHTIRLNTENALQVRLTPGEELIDHTAPVRVLWNDADAGTYTFEDGAITLQSKGYSPIKPFKTPKVCGPIGDINNTPYAIVVGTLSKDARMNKFCQLRAESARDEWETWQHVKPRYFLDTEITNDQISKYSLILFGGPDENLVTRKLVEQIPLKIESDSMTIGGRNFPAQNAGVSMVYPNPLNPERYVVINASNSPDAMFFINRLPGRFDYAIAETKAIGNSDIPFEKGCVVAGCFDYNWQYSDKYAMPGDVETRGKAPTRKAPKYLTAILEDSKLMLSELLENKTSGSFVYMERDLNSQGKPLMLDGRTYKSGIGVEFWHEPCWVTYDLTGGEWKHLKATLGIELGKKPEELEEKEKNGTCNYFVVSGDGKELYHSPIFRWDSKPVEMDVDIKGVKILELRIGNESTWYNAASSLNWADIRLEK